MNYALIENGIVTNIIWLYPGNASDFPNAVPMGEYPVAIGDTYENGLFFRDGVRVKTASEAYELEIKNLNKTVEELDTALYEAVCLNLEG